MKKRSKLDLSPGVKRKKSQAAGFDAAAGTKPAAESRSVAEPQPARKKASGEHRQPRSSVVVEPGRPPRMVLAATIAVVAVAALSLYVLKRR